MRSYVKIVSFIVFTLFSIINIMAIVDFGYAIIVTKQRLNELTPLLQANDYEFFDSLFGRPIYIIILIGLSVLILILIAEFILKIMFYTGAVKDGSPEMYFALSVESLIECVVNSVLFIIAICTIIVPEGIEHARNQDRMWFYWFASYVLSLFWIILNIIFSYKLTQVEKDQKYLKI